MSGTTNKAGSPLYSYRVAPHLQSTFDVPMSTFREAHPQYNYYVVAGFIFTTSKNKDKDGSRRVPASASPAAQAAVAANQPPPPLTLLLRRALSDSYGGYWDFAGGSLEESDQTLLDGVAREVLEETGYHVSRIRDLARVDEWTQASSSHRLPAIVLRVAKFSFVVDVHEANDTKDWEENARLDPKEHMAFAWATEDEVRRSVLNKHHGRREEGPYAFVGVQGETLLEGFRKFKAL
jgi:8-oxo-dGTP pyrophosphatase MutT (NUDIX family)